MNLRATRVEINVEQFKKNLLVFKNIIGKDKPLCLAVKGNAYGHGLIAMAHHAQAVVDILAVATVNEGVQLRESGILIPILVLSAHLEKEIPILCQYKLTPLISHGESLSSYQYWAEYFNITLSLHLKIDTGMSRAGVLPELALALAQNITKFPNLFLEGICTHLAVADGGEEWKKFTDKQISTFKKVIDTLQQHSIKPPLIHAANSFGILCHPESHFTMARVGIGAYGYAEHPALKPVMEFKTKITIVKTIAKGSSVSYGCTWVAPEDTKIGIVPVGYADGYMRCLSNKAKVLIDGKFYPVLGRVCMDQMAIALPDDDSCMEKDVLLYGNHPELNANTLALLADTISYEILTAIADRVPRFYI